MFLLLWISVLGPSGRKSSATIPYFPLPTVVLLAQKVTIQQTRMLEQLMV